MVSPGIFYEQLLVQELFMKPIRREPSNFVTSEILLPFLVIHCVIGTYDTRLVLFLIDFFS